MSRSSDSKANRKKSKYSSILRRLYGVGSCSEPTQHLMVCNAGLSLGINKEDLLLAFDRFGRIRSINMVSKESHAFVEFEKAEDAEVCFSEYNGKQCLPNLKCPVYLLFMEKQPAIGATEVFRNPPGCLIFEDFVSEMEEAKLLKCVEGSLQDGGDLKQRKVAHFGYEFLYGKNNIDKDNPLERGIPAECDIIKDRLELKGYVLPWKPDQLTVNRYLAGQGIPPHIDTHSAFEDPIMSLSLGSDCVMEFRKDGQHWSVVLPRRSLLVMSGESRYGWTHGISSRKSDVVARGGCLVSKQRGTRVSFTFRRVKRTPCECGFQALCDSRAKPPQQPTELEEEYVHKVYENISDHFSRTRHKPWPAVLELVKSFPPGSIVLDVGCGNCKYFGFAELTYEIGSDHSFGLLSISQERGFQAVRSNCLSLPFKDSSVDGVLCIAVIHHLSSPERRLHSVKEILRVLSVDGSALIYVWAKDQKYQGKSSNYLKYGAQPASSPDGTNAELPVHVNRTDFTEGQNDVFVPWKLKNEAAAEPSSTFLRYYHVFDEGELDRLCVTAGAVIEKSYYDNGNWCCLIRKQAVL